MKNIVVLGSTGSIGVSSLDVIDKLGAGYGVLALSANTNADLLIKQMLKFKPRFVAVLNEDSYQKVKPYVPENTKLLPPDEDSLIFLASLPSADLIINGLVGAVGFMPLVTAIKNGKTIALANKEPIVMAGKSIMEECYRWKATILPVDSEPSAIFQCLQGTPAGRKEEDISRLLLTASGGPFFKYKGALSRVKPEAALAHPRWVMGKKITIDSATLMNKGFETIEIMHLFNVSLSDIEIVIHPQSIIHSAVEFKDGSILAQLSQPDMRLPIQYAVTYPNRMPSPVKKLTVKDMAKLEFAAPDFKKFPCLELALWSAQKEGAFPAVLSAADEIAVDAYLKEKILFTDIPKLIYSVLKETRSPSGKITISEAAEFDVWAREKAREFLANKKYKKTII
ncbi:1-Deoxy-D-xylulose 5-phosphate reductoisomerase [Elusimicrobium minutum Pei191]|uniref:1-deoxy-D-xylulose 5-phosphate reductoisomerase n=1 Tax=Elusimicrobium minutum (strain Pei191) TaxID=445932 RepID=DXR_ELUMP|nr:1-deoxy-D-xylulose-5-phosphate reductoisomerase [Elusimicrobium minutum]B2KCJ9.1 RecName: Full=1-deoxy-D-xylulose 5-phosphate reductoisomerase; Short=DXP reductoisomerase; AltName: Full=1-deoxyxylulose-5-phosphate reductoisomerase; AltName: Full=2-C-methyl-D-erythritol 4-phosphate synthase [Elusimicrobium minutum Pei191]ACC98245.1 1-Deoxy-D-xylulose 5-phosphate reductoisomerase [Elusimicrobium minutum Pei191]